MDSCRFVTVKRKKHIVAGEDTALCGWPKPKKWQMKLVEYRWPFTFANLTVLVLGLFWFSQVFNLNWLWLSLIFAGYYFERKSHKRIWDYVEDDE